MEGVGRPSWEEGVGWLRIVGPVWKEWWREVVAGWRRNECAGGREALGSGLLAGQAGNKDAAC